MNTPSKYTLNNALALLAITDRTRGLQIGTKLAVDRYYDFDCSDANKPFYRLTEEGWSRVRQSRLWKAHQHLLGMGFVLDRTMRQRSSCMMYFHQDDVRRSAHTGHHGRVYAEPERGEDGKWRPSELVAEYKNGEE